MVSQEDSIDYMNIYEDYSELDTPSLFELHKLRRVFTNKQEQLEFFVTGKLLEERKFDLIQRLEDELNQNTNQITLRSLKIHHILSRLYLRNDADIELGEKHSDKTFQIYEQLVRNRDDRPEVMCKWGEIILEMGQNKTGLYIPSPETDFEKQLINYLHENADTIKQALIDRGHFPSSKTKYEIITYVPKEVHTGFNKM